MKQEFYITSWIPYCTGYYNTSYCKTKAKELRQNPKYVKVRVSGHIKENGKTYAKIYVRVSRDVAEKI